MSTTAATIRDYLSAAYEPDCDYVDGEVLERNLGEFDHARLQGAVFAYFYAHRKQLGHRRGLRITGPGCTHTIPCS